MPRNVAGTYVLPIGAFSTGGIIKASDHNSNYSDIATALTQSAYPPSTTPQIWVAPQTFGALATFTAGAAVTGGLATDTLNVSGAASFGAIATLTVTGNATVGGTLGVTGAAAFAAGTFSGTLGVVGKASFTSTDSMAMPNGTTAQRSGTPAAGDVRYNSTTGLLEFWNGALWLSVLGTQMPAAFKNLSIKVLTNTTVAVAADFVTVTDGANFQNVAVSATCDLGSNGAVNKLDAGSIAIDTWYAIWVITKPDGTTGTLASTSFTAPTMPAGYTFKARIGAVQTVHASAQLYGTWQLGRRAQYVVGLAQTAALPNMAIGVAGTYSATAPTWAPVAVARFVPPTASEINVLAMGNWKAAGSSIVAIAPNNSCGGSQNASGNVPAFDIGPVTVVNSLTAFSMILESTNIYWASSANGGAVSCLGWVDNI